MTLRISDRATVALSAAFQSHVDGVMLLRASKGFLETAMEADKYDLMAPLHFVASNHYKTKDGRYYQCHASMNAAPMMKMLGVRIFAFLLHQAPCLSSD